MQNARFATLRGTAFRKAERRSRARAFRWTALRHGLSVAGLFSASFAFAADPFPQGGKYVAGSGIIYSNSFGVDVIQSSTRGVIDWRGFSIAKGNTVTITNGSGATLSRVTGSDRSLISGNLYVTGSFYLINPQGIVIGQTGVISTGGRFVASSLDIDTNAFMNDMSLIAKGSQGGEVVNLGNISSVGGDIFLISPSSAVNAGSIDAPRGSVELAVGHAVLLRDSSAQPQVYVQSGSHGDVVNKGAIRAAQISLQAADGNVFALAGRNSELRATGVGKRNGHIWLLAETGALRVHGDIKVAGETGQLDTQAREISLAHATVEANHWNLTIPGYRPVPKSTEALSRSLSKGTSITVHANGTSAGTGDIDLRSNLSWNGNATLTLNADHSVRIASTSAIANNGAGNLTLRADAEGIDNGGAVVNRGTVDWSKSSGTVAMLADLKSESSSGTIHSSAQWVAPPYSGLKTQTTTYRLINTLDDLTHVADNMGGTYALGKDIVGTADAGFIAAIGSRTGSSFSGQFDGMGHVINGIGIYSGGSDDDYTYTHYTGLFSSVGAAGVVRNLGVVNSDATSFVSPVGMIAGRSAGLITNSFSTGSVSSEDDFSAYGTGGLVGINDGVIERSWSSASGGSSGGSGGLASTNTGLILQSFTTSEVYGGAHSVVGGLVDYNSGTIRQSYAAGSAGALVAGGLVDYNEGKIEESFSATALTPSLTPSVGGIADTNLGHIANNVFWNKQLAIGFNGVDQGTPVPATNGLTTAYMSIASSFGPTWDFSPTGTWVIAAGTTHPILRWQQAAH